MPTALAALTRSTVLRRAMGDALINAIIAGRPAEVERSNRLSPQDAVRQVLWRY